MTKREQEISAAMWQTIGKVATKEGNRNDLGEGRKYPVNLLIKGAVAGKDFNERITGILMVGFDSETTSTSSPEGDHLTALILSSVPKSRQAELLDSLADYFAEHGELPEIDETLLDQITHLAKKLRSRGKPVTRRGTVKFSHAAAAASVA